MEWRTIPRVALQGKSGDPLPASEARLFQEIRAHTIAALAGGSDTRIESVAANN